MKIGGVTMLASFHDWKKIFHYRIVMKSDWKLILKIVTVISDYFIRAVSCCCLYKQIEAIFTNKTWTFFNSQ